MGFCIFNTATVAARHAQAAHGLARIAIFDFDVHHGNGTDDAFADDASVLYVSAHQEGSYPGTGKMSGVGRGDGEGATVNVTLPGDAGNAAYRALWEEVVLPRIDRFAPDMIIVSAGALRMLVALCMLLCRGTHIYSACALFVQLRGLVCRAACAVLCYACCVPFFPVASVCRLDRLCGGLIHAGHAGWAARAGLYVCVSMHWGGGHAQLMAAEWASTAGSCRRAGRVHTVTHSPSCVCVGRSQIA